MNRPTPDQLSEAEFKEAFAEFRKLEAHVEKFAADIPGDWESVRKKIEEARQAFEQAYKSRTTT